MANPKLPAAAVRLHAKRGQADCTIAALASYLRVDPEEVLIAASKSHGNVWKSGLYGPHMVSAARRLGFKVRWRRLKEHTQLDEASGVLSLSYRDQAERSHVVLILEGKIFENEHDPVSMWEADVYLSTHNAYPAQILELK